MIDDTTFFRLGYVPGEPEDAVGAKVRKVPLSLQTLSAHSDSEEPENEFDVCFFFLITSSLISI